MYINQLGQGPDLVMLHGWSMHSGVWQPLADLLAEKFTLHLVDLPGHGQSPWGENALQLDNFLHSLSQSVPASAHWLGWSLGGQLSLAFASRYPQRVTKLILIAANPKFVASEEWENAMDAKVFDAFAKQLNHNQRETLIRFVMLMARGAKGSQDTVKLLAEQSTDSIAVPEALEAGLDLLETLDLRQALKQLEIPVKFIVGDRDHLVPITLTDVLPDLNPRLTVTRIDGAGHAPFISRPTLCAKLINEFLDD